MYKYKKYTHSETLVGEKGPPEHNIWSDGNSGFITSGGKSWSEIKAIVNNRTKNPNQTLSTQYMAGSW